MENQEINWEAVQDLMEHSKVLQVRFPLSGKVELWIPIELMQQATDYAKEIQLDVELKDLSNFEENSE